MGAIHSLASGWVTEKPRDRRSPMAALMSLSVILAAVGIVKPRHRFPEEREARVAAAVAAAGEEADEFFHRV